MKREVMNAVVCKKYGPPEVLFYTENAVKPVPKPKQLLVRVHATAVNSGDVRVRGLQVSGFLRIIMRLVLGVFKPRNPILGLVFSGIVEQVGSDVKSFKTGDEVFGMTGFDMGTYASYLTIAEKKSIALKPDNASHEEAAAIVFGGGSAIYFLEKAGVKSGKDLKVLVYGATGAVGTSAIQIAKYYDAEVTAVCSDSGIALSKSLGAADVINYKAEDFTENGKKYDIIFDAVGKLKKRNCKNSLKNQGKYVSVASLDVAAENKEQLEFLKMLFEANKLDAVIDKVYNLNEMVEAHRYVDTGRKKGNVVIKVTGS